jgi:hypothetical protein
MQKNKKYFYKTNATSGLKQYKCLYESNINYMNKFRKSKKQNGGFFLFSKDFPNIDLSNKVVVFWRMLMDRPIDIIRMYDLPEKEDEIYKFFRENIVPAETHFRTASRLIPENFDLLTYLRNDDAYSSNEEEYTAKAKRHDQYNIYQAIINPSDGKVETIHFGIFRKIFQAFFDTTTNEQKVISALESWWANRNKEVKQNDYNVVFV